MKHNIFTYNHKKNNFNLTIEDDFIKYKVLDAISEVKELDSLILASIELLKESLLDKNYEQNSTSNNINKTL